MPPVMPRPKVDIAGYIQPTPYFLKIMCCAGPGSEWALSSKTSQHSKEVLFAHSYFFSFSQEQLQLACIATHGF